MFRIVAIALATLGLTYAAWANSATTLFSKFAPERGLQMDPASAQALINTTEQAAGRQDKSAFKKIARSRALQALRSEPLSPRAIRQLGSYYALIGDTARARPLMLLSTKLSRRDTPGQLWLADNALKAGRAKDALRAIDIVIRTQPETSEAAFQAIGNALADPKFRSEFVSYVKTPPDWLAAFIEYNIGALKQPQVLSATLVQMHPLRRGLLSEDATERLLVALTDRGPVNEARAFYLQQPGASPNALVSLEFPNGADNFRYAPIGWQMLNGPDVQGFGDVDGNSASIEVLAMPGRRGTAARKLLFLSAGAYRWTANADLSGLGGGAGTLSVLCNARQGQWVRSASKDLGKGPNSFDFVVPANCPAQLLTIDAAGADSQSEGNLTLSNLRISGAGNRSMASQKTSGTASPQKN